MLTIRWYRGDDQGTESVFQADSVGYEGRVLKVWGNDVPPKLMGELRTGCAYVMNETGATVAIYHLGNSQPDSATKKK